jgi:hypothetical protein
MSAMPALDWPEDEPASWPAATWTVPAQPARTEPARHTPRDQGPRDQGPRDQAAHGLAANGQAVNGQAVPGQVVRAHAVRGQMPRGEAVRAHAVPAQVPRAQAIREHTVRSQAVHAQAPHGATAPAPLRLTRRGRIVAAAALLVILLSVLVTGGAWAISHSAPSRGADRSLAQVVVQPGQSLWSVAQTADPNADPDRSCSRSSISTAWPAMWSWSASGCGCPAAEFAPAATRRRAKRATRRPPWSKRHGRRRFRISDSWRLASGPLAYYRDHNI